jgi:hypothetical protein
MKDEEEKCFSSNYHTTLVLKHAWREECEQHEGKERGLQKKSADKGFK